jgi:hypothetical protein
MGLLGFLRLENWRNIYRSTAPGNLEGDGTTLGGVFVLGPGDQGLVYEHREGTWGDNVDPAEVGAAAGTTMLQVLEAVESMTAAR